MKIAFITLGPEDMYTARVSDGLTTATITCVTLATLQARCRQLGARNADEMFDDFARIEEERLAALEQARTKALAKTDVIPF